MVRRCITALIAVVVALGSVDIAHADDGKPDVHAERHDFISKLRKDGVRRAVHQTAGQTSAHTASTDALVPVLPTPNADAGACGAAATVTGTACTAPPAAQAPALPRITGGLVLQAFQRIPVPHLRSQTQPDDKTLVNFDTL